VKARGVAIALVLVAAPASHAHAGTNPGAAEGQVVAARKADDGFCQRPTKPLRDSLQLCGYAKEVEDCDGFAAACAEALAPKKPPDLGWLEKLARFFAKFGQLFEGLGTVAHVLVWAVVIALVVLMAYPLLKSLLRMRRRSGDDVERKKKQVEVAAAPLEELLDKGDEQALLARAEAALAAGDLTAALHAFLAATLRALDRRGALQIARDRTNGEYVRACQDEAARVTLKELVREVDRVQFGALGTEPERVRTLGQRAAAIVRAVLPLSVLLLLACGAVDTKKLRMPTGNPAGQEVFERVMTAQGVRLGRPPKPLGLLEKPGAATPPILVDFGRVPLDEDTEKHLVQWVREGGTLIAVDQPHRWPKELRPSTSIGGQDMVVQQGDAKFEGKLLPGPAFALESQGTIVATTGNEAFAILREYGSGQVLGLASSDLMTNVGMSVPGNAAALVAILGTVNPRTIDVAHEEDGTTPPSNPFIALSRAGLGLGLWHALVATGLLFLAVGIRASRPIPDRPPRRRAFTEHGGAVGALYARARLGHVAVAALGRLLELRARARAPRTQDVSTWLALRVGRDPEEVRALLHRAELARKDTVPVGDETKTLEELSSLYAAMEKTS